MYMVVNEFKIHSYGITELAMLYSPELTASGALKRFRRWIDTNHILHEQLGFIKGKRRPSTFTPSEVKIIVAQLGEP